jgi:hypothetical protein
LENRRYGRLESLRYRPRRNMRLGPLHFHGSGGC